MNFVLRTNETGPRLEYILHVIFSIHLGLPYRITNSWDECGEHDLIINYCTASDERAQINLYKNGLLSEKGINQHIPEIGADLDMAYFFEIPQEESENFLYPFDLFAMCFYFLSRYEEYQEFTPDALGRYSSNNSLASLYGFLDVPLIDTWIINFRKNLEKKIGSVIPSIRSYQNVPTIDIDIPYAFKGKTWKNIPGLFKDILSWNYTRFLQRWTYIKSGEDPFDTYKSMNQTMSRYGLKPTYYFLLKYKKPLDENHVIHDPDFKDLVSNIADNYPVGMHPSVASSRDPNSIASEKALMEKLSGQKIIQSRQHYVMLSLPATYQRLIENNITDDASMMYADRIGFRASTSVPFPWYDLEQEERTSLRISPACIMDASMKWYMHLQPQDAMHIIEEYKSAVKKVDGQFVWIWHNSSFSDGHGWKGWDAIFHSLCK